MLDGLLLAFPNYKLLYLLQFHSVGWLADADAHMQWNKLHIAFGGMEWVVAIPLCSVSHRAIKANALLLFCCQAH